MTRACPSCGQPPDHVHLSPAAASGREREAETREVPVPLPMQETRALREGRVDLKPRESRPSRRS